MKLHQIEYFLAVEKYKSFSTAALEINISQSTLSQQIATLEKELGVHLFVRNKRNIYLSRAGQEFLNKARKIMLEVQSAQELMHKYSTCDKGFIRIGLLPSLYHLGITRIITDFIRTHDKFEINYHIENTDNLLEQIRSKRIHLAFVNAPFQNEFDVSFFPIIDECFVVLVNRANPLTKKSILDIEDLDTENLLFHSSNSTIHRTLQKAFEKAGTKFEPVLESDNVDLIGHFADENLGISILGSRVAESLLTPNTTTIPLSKVIHVQSGLAIPNSSSGFMIPPVIRTFRDFTLKEIAELQLLS